MNIFQHTEKVTTMNRQVIKFDVLGRPQGLLMRKGGVDITKLPGVKCAVTRATDIRWDEKAGMWYIHFLIEPFASQNLTEEMYHEMMGTPYLTEVGMVMLFTEYDEAVAVEIEFINKCYERGVM